MLTLPPPISRPGMMRPFSPGIMYCRPLLVWNSSGTVLKEVPEEWVKAQGLLEVRSEISDKNLYLTRPDMGRRLCAEAVEALKAQCVANPDVQVVISDGLSTDAITVNYEEILPPLMAGLKQAGLKVGTPFFVRYGRVKIEDQIDRKSVV